MLVLAIALVLGAAVFPSTDGQTGVSTGCGPEEQEFFYKYAYLERSKNASYTDDDFQGAVSMYQCFMSDYGLLPTAMCDNETIAWMKKDRCGCEDMIKQEPKMMPQNLYGPQEYNIGNTKWRKKLLTWSVIKYPRNNNHLSHREVDDAMKRGLEIWADSTSLRFQKVTGTDADIQISFEVRRHTQTGPFYDFDGRSGVLAHAFFPQSGIVHFDDDENFQLNKNEGTELFIVAAHEFGHTLGISHSNIKEALMAPYYRYSPDLKLHRDDVGAIHALYGRNTNPVPENPTRGTVRPTRGTVRPTRATTTPRRPKPTAPEECDMVITASFKMDQITYVFTRVREQRWRRVTYIYKVYDNRGLDISSKTRVRDMFVKGRSNRSRYRVYPRRVDAAVYVPDQRKVYLISGTRMYRYTSSGGSQFTIESSYPKWMNVRQFPERPRAVIAKEFGNNQRRQYFMIILSESMLWVWNPMTNRVQGMPYPLKAFGHMMPQSIDSAFSVSHDVVYMLRGGKIYSFDVRKWRITQEEDGKSLVYQFLNGPCM